jgi:predicted kinase
MSPARPRVFVVLGPAGSGKSTVAKLVARRYSALYLDKDRVSGPFVRLVLELNGEDPHSRESNDFYMHHVMRTEYETLFDVCADNLDLGSSVVIDAPFAAYTRDPHFLTESARRAGWPDAEVIVVHVRTSEHVVRERVIARRSARDAWKLDNWQEFWSRFGTVQCAWTGVRHVDVINDAAEPDLGALCVLDG